MASSRERPIQSTQDRSTTEEIAKDTDTPAEDVEKIYEQELSSLASDAKITQYLGVLATRRVRLMLRRH
jgi:hypothetical protein